ncbi:MFS-type transporter clz9 [Labeo rohita]|nr:MFS-type transporter clz9 [Labeo rohita]
MPIGWMGPPSPSMASRKRAIWTRSHFIRYAPEERPLLLIMDQHETHVSKDVTMYCRENKIEILCLPAQTTHILQPLDTAVFNPLKTVFSTMASRMGLVRGDVVVGKKQFSALLKHVYPTAATAENIKAGFHEAGIFPLSRAAVDTTQVILTLIQ